MGKRICIGDIVEIPTAIGLAYVQFSQKHSGYGALIRILPGFFKSRPADFSVMANKPESFVTFFPLQAAVNRKIFDVVANFPVPDFAKPFPLFRDGVADPITRKVKVWWFWNGQKEWKVGNITLEQRKLPIRGIWTDALLVKRLESGWTPEKDKC